VTCEHSWFNGCGTQPTALMPGGRSLLNFDFSTLPNGKKTVKIELTGSRRADEVLANKAAGLERTPKGHTCHHVEDEGTMMLVPTDLHQEVAHTGGRATFQDRTGVDYAN